MFEALIKLFIPAQQIIQLFTLKIETSKAIEEIAKNVESECAGHNFALLKSYVYHEIVESKGFPIQRKVFIYDICRAKTASMMLTSNPEFSNFMPCTFSIYEENNKTIISTKNMELLLDAVKSNKALFSEATDLFSTFKSMLNKLAK